MVPAGIAPIIWFNCTVSVYFLASEEKSCTKLHFIKSCRCNWAWSRNSDGLIHHWSERCRFTDRFYSEEFTLWTLASVSIQSHTHTQIWWINSGNTLLTTYNKVSGRKSEQSKVNSSKFKVPESRSLSSSGSASSLTASSSCTWWRGCWACGSWWCSWWWGSSRPPGRSRTGAAWWTRWFWSGRRRSSPRCSGDGLRSRQSNLLIVSWMILKTFCQYSFLYTNFNRTMQHLWHTAQSNYEAIIIKQQLYSIRFYTLAATTPWLIDCD